MKPLMPDVSLIHIPIIDSTNNYAMQLIDAGMADAGMAILADAQSAGKGQRGKSWIDMPGESLLMSVILAPEMDLEWQFSFSAAIAVIIADALMGLYEHWDVCIKWPNDIIVNDKKAGGILIENVLRGISWSHCVVGVGINVLQTGFPASLPFATSLKIAAGKDFDVKALARAISSALASLKAASIINGDYLDRYNACLYRKDAAQTFSDGSHEWQAVIRSAGRNGQLAVELADGNILHYTHGLVEWKWR